MAFNSLEFLFFFGLGLLFFQAVRKHILFSRIYLAVISWAFYLLAEPKFFPYLLGLGLVNYLTSLGIVRWPQRKTLLLTLVIALDVAFLIGAKLVGKQNQHFPLGVSFFTFQIISFVLDTASGRSLAPLGFWHFFSYMFFFPHLVAGPICRPSGLLQQMSKPFGVATPSQVRAGFYLISFGLLKKAVLADAIGFRVDEIFSFPSATKGILSWSIVFVAYGWQIYFDFSGYTDMARGMGKLFGLELPKNFNFPYFASNLQEFWRRWHMTLSTWFRDFVYLPLGGSKNSSYHYIGAILATFILSALWHGFGWNYVLWGFWHGIWLIIFRYFMSDSPEVLKRSFTLFVVFFGWFFFRVDNLHQLQQILILMGQPPAYWSFPFLSLRDLVILISLSFILEVAAALFMRKQQQLSRFASDALWLTITLLALTFQSPLKEFVYARF